MKTVFLLLGLLLSIFASHPVFGQLSVDKSIIEFDGKSTMQDIEITNKGSYKLYLDLVIAEIINPEHPSPTRVELTDPRSAPILVNPRQVLLAPGQRKRVRIILREPAAEIDSIYRLKVKPYTGKVRLNSEDDDLKASGLKILVGYDLLVIARPETLVPDVQVNRTNDSIEFKNSGNTNVMLSKITQCHSSGNQCSEIKPNRLYVGETYTVALPNKGDRSNYPVKVIQSVIKGGDTNIY